MARRGNRASLESAGRSRTPVQADDRGLLEGLRDHVLELPLEQLRAWIRRLRSVLEELEAHSEILAEERRRQVVR